MQSEGDVLCVSLANDGVLTEPDPHSEQKNDHHEKNDSGSKPSVLENTCCRNRVITPSTCKACRVAGSRYSR
jgi:hypothetical protein